MIYKTIENDCVGCPQGCINCGRREDYILYHVECDLCGCEEEDMYEYNGRHYCPECLVKTIIGEMDKEEIIEFINACMQKEFISAIGDAVLVDADDLRKGEW